MLINSLSIRKSSLLTRKILMFFSYLISFLFCSPSPSLRGLFLLSPLTVVARSLLAILTKQSPCHFPESPPLPSLRGSCLLSSRSNLRVTSPILPPSPSLRGHLYRRCEVTSCYPHEAISVSLPRISPPPVVARSLLAILTKQSPCHSPLSP